MACLGTDADTELGLANVKLGLLGSAVEITAGESTGPTTQEKCQVI